MTKAAPNDNGIDDALLEEASAWFLRLDNAMREGVDVALLKEGLENWLTESELHAIAYRKIETGWHVARSHATAPEIVIARRDALESAHRIVRSTTRSLGVGWRAAVAAVVLLGIAIPATSWLIKRGDEITYETAIGETRVITLADDSRVTMDGHTKIAIDFSPQVRDVHLLRGQAEFVVAKDPMRAFRVTAGDRTIVAHGTAFNVELVEGQLLVTLLEGHVSVAPSEPEASRPLESKDLTPGQQMIVNRVGVTELRPKINLESATSWRDGKLVFEDEPLSEVVARINRQSRVQITIDDPRIADMTINGVYTGDTRAFFDAIERYFPVHVTGKRDNLIHLVSAK